MDDRAVSSMLSMDAAATEKIKSGRRKR